MKYYANFNSDGSSWMNDMEFTNKVTAIRVARESAESIRLPGNSCSWYVRAEDGREIRGGMTRTGKRWREYF